MLQRCCCCCCFCPFFGGGGKPLTTSAFEKRGLWSPNYSLTSLGNKGGTGEFRFPPPLFQSNLRFYYLSESEVHQTTDCIILFNFKHWRLTSLGSGEKKKKDKRNLLFWMKVWNGENLLCFCHNFPEESSFCGVSFFKTLNWGMTTSFIVQIEM